VPGNARARSFDSVADQYAAVRPGYPDSMYRFITGAACLCSQSTIVEVGCGTAKASLPFAQQGFPMVCVEPGRRLAAIAREILRPFPNAVVEQSTFEGLGFGGQTLFSAVLGPGLSLDRSCGCNLKAPRDPRPGWNSGLGLERSSS